MGRLIFLVALAACTREAPQAASSFADARGVYRFPSEPECYKRLAEYHGERHVKPMEGPYPTVCLSVGEGGGQD